MVACYNGTRTNKTYLLKIKAEVFGNKAGVLDNNAGVLHKKKRVIGESGRREGDGR